MKTPAPQQYKIVGNYLYAPLESTEKFSTIQAAREKNRLWTKAAEATGQRWKGRVVKVKA